MRNASEETRAECRNADVIMWAVQGVRGAAHVIFRVRLVVAFGAFSWRCSRACPSPAGAASPIDSPQTSRALRGHPGACRPTGFALASPIPQEWLCGEIQGLPAKLMGAFQSIVVASRHRRFSALHGAGAYSAAADTERHASVLARAWRHRRLYFFDVDARRGGAGCALTPGDRPSYLETLESQRSAADLANHAQGWARVEAIRRAFA